VLRSQQPLAVTARRNIFDSDGHVLLMGLRQRAEPPQPQEMVEILRSVIQWSEESNLYRRGCKYVAGATAQRPFIVHPARIEGLGDWLKLWKLRATGSVEGAISFHERGGSPKGPLRLDGVDNPSGEVPQNVGADPDRVGPGAADPQPR